MITSHNPRLFRRLGRSGIKVSPLGLGTARIAGLGFREEDSAPLIVTVSQKRAAVRQIQAAVDIASKVKTGASLAIKDFIREVMSGEVESGNQECCVKAASCC